MALDTGSTAFMLICMGLVQLMTPGLAFFYGGLVRSTNVVTIMLQNFVCLGLVFVLWYLVVFSLAFGPTVGGLIGNPLTYCGWSHIHADTEFDGVDGIPGLVFAGYQGMFAVITPALMTGAFADRMRWTPYVLFVALWVFLVYAPVCHWVWGGGWMQTWGVKDFAGGIVCHATSGFGALASIIKLGKRTRSEDPEANHPHNVPLVALGTALLWFGWFGFNGGSALAAGPLAAQAALNTQLAGSVALCGWLAMESLAGKKHGLVGACVGAVAGLATITPAAGFVNIGGAFFIGGAASVVCFGCVLVLNALGLDDALDVWGVHGMGGVTGTILLGFLAEDRINPGTEASMNLVWIQFVCVSIVALYSFVATYALLSLLEVFMFLRPRKSEEFDLDMVLHSEAAYVTHELSQKQERSLKAKAAGPLDSASDSSDSGEESEADKAEQGTLQQAEQGTLQQGMNYMKIAAASVA